MLALSTSSSSVTIDTAQQKIFIMPNRLLFRVGAPRVVSFEEIEQVYLDYWEESYTIPDEYTPEQRTRRRWAVMLTLKDGQTVTVGEEKSDHRVGQTTVLAQQHARWEELATRVSELVGKPLTHMAEVPGGPHTFVQAIESILQRRLLQSGLNNQSVRIQSGKDLGVEIIVNGKSYAAVEEVEDEIVRNLIQASIHEWQGSSKG